MTFLNLLIINYYHWMILSFFINIYIDFNHDLIQEGHVCSCYRCIFIEIFIFSIFTIL